MTQPSSIEVQQQAHLAQGDLPTLTEGTRLTPEDPPIITDGTRLTPDPTGSCAEGGGALTGINGGGTSGNHGNGTAG
jgi:hypothetical protein